MKRRWISFFLCLCFSLALVVPAPVYAEESVNGSAAVAAALRGLGVGVSKSADLTAFQEECQNIWNNLSSTQKALVTLVSKSGKTMLEFPPVFMKAVWEKFTDKNRGFNPGGGTFGGAGASRDFPKSDDGITEYQQRVWSFINSLKPGMYLSTGKSYGFTEQELSSLFGFNVRFADNLGGYSPNTGIIPWINNIRVEAVCEPAALYDACRSEKNPLFLLGDMSCVTYGFNYTSPDSYYTSVRLESAAGVSRFSYDFGCNAGNGNSSQSCNLVIVSFECKDKLFLSYPVYYSSNKLTGLVFPVNADFYAKSLPSYPASHSDSKYWADGVSVINNDIDVVINRVTNAIGENTPITVDNNSTVSQLVQTSQTVIYNNTTIVTESDYTNNQQTNVNKEGDNYWGAVAPPEPNPDDSSSKPNPDDSSSKPDPDDSSSKPDPDNSSSSPDDGSGGGFSWDWLWNLIKGFGKFLGEAIAAFLEALGSALTGLKGIFSLMTGFLEFLGGALTFLPPEIWMLITICIVLGFILRIFGK